MAEEPDSKQLLAELEPWLGAPRWWLGLSGGLDSCVLLQLLVEARAQVELPPLSAIHVNHQLSADSGRWQQHCEQLCEVLDVPLEVRLVSVDPGDSGLESAARSARYRVYEELVGPDELLLLAHHLDDQVETFFLRLMRGAGARGLSGMPATRPMGRGSLCRPLLAFRRDDLERYAGRQGLEWVEDPSNSELFADRNYLRHQVLPQLAERWPGYRGSVATSMEALADAEAGLLEFDEALLKQAGEARFGESVLRLDVLDSLSERELARLIRRWLERSGFAAPGRERLAEFARQLRAAQADSQPELGGSGYMLRRYRDAIHLCPTRPEPRLPAGCTLVPGEVLEVPGLGRLLLQPVPEGGVRLPDAGHWAVALRAGGERCRPSGRAHSQSLKKLLQDSTVPPWQRGLLPLLYGDGEIAAVADLWVCSGWEAGARPGYVLCWDRPDQLRAR